MKAAMIATMGALLGLASQAMAQEGGGLGPQMRAACGADIQALCPTEQPGPERNRCIMLNINNLSQACRSAIGALQSAAGEMRAVCAGDIRQFCAGASGPARMQCMRQNQGRLSPGCQSALASLEQRGMAH